MLIKGEEGLVDFLVSHYKDEVEMYNSDEDNTFFLVDLTDEDLPQAYINRVRDFVDSDSTFEVLM